MKGFGFVAGEDGTEYFVHQTALGDGVTIDENDTVEFDVEQGDRGPKAVNVKRAEASEASGDQPAEEEQAEVGAPEQDEVGAPDEEDDQQEAA